MAFRDIYSSYIELSRYEQDGRDFRILAESRPSPVLVITPHGGGIEPGTSEIVRGIAAGRFSYYCFEGIKSTGNETLHLTSTRFDELQALRMVQAAQTVVAIHGLLDGGWVEVGGLDGELRLCLTASLQAAGFHARPDGSREHSGSYPTNLCNRGLTGRGLQLEIGEALRQQMFHSLDRAGRKHPTGLFHHFVATVQDCLEKA